MVEGPNTAGMVSVYLAGQTLHSAQVVDWYSATKTVRSSPADPDNKNNGMVLWGDDNLFPQDALEKIKLLPGLSSGMNFLTLAFSSFTLRYGVLKGYKEDGTPEYDTTMIPEVEEFFRVNPPKKYFKDFASEAFRLWNPVVTLYKTVNGKAIGRIVVERTKDVRFALMDQDGYIREIYINANWKKGETKESKNTITRKAIDEYMNGEDIIAKNDVVSMILTMPETGDDYYQEAPWYSFVRSGWYEIAANIPRIKKARMKHMAAPSFVLYIPDSYFKQKYANTWGKNRDEDTRVVAAEIDAWKKSVLNVDNQGKMIASLFHDDPNTGKQYAKWELKKVEMNDGGEYLEDSYESYLMLYRSLGFDGQLIGSIPAKSGQGNSGGADKREGTNVLMTWLNPIASIALSPFEVARDFNKWNPYLRFWVDVPYMPSKNEITTSDRTPTGKTN